MTFFILQSLYFFLPAAFANMAPVMAAALRLPFGVPISSQLFGENKTWRGFVFGYLAALGVLYVQQILYQQGGFWIDLSVLQYDGISIFLYAAAFGVGALVGDAAKSFFKRRLGYLPGKSWPPFDQIDFVLGAVVFLLPLHVVSLQMFLVLVLVVPLLHVLVNIAGYFLGLKKVWW